MDQSLKLIFINSLNKAVTLTIPYAKTGLTGAEVKAAMTAIITNNVFDSTGGDLVSAKAASFIQTNTTDLAVV